MLFQTYKVRILLNIYKKEKRIHQILEKYVVLQSNLDRLYVMVFVKTFQNLNTTVWLFYVQL